MSQSLEECYEQALTFLEETIPSFARLYPSQAGGLLAKEDGSCDPHLERMIEGCAMLAGRVDHKIDSEFPFLIESLLQVLYPHLTLVVPSMAIVQLRGPDPASLPNTGLTIPAGAMLSSSPLGRHHVACHYRTGYPTTLWPVQLRSAQWQSPPPQPYSPPVQNTAYGRGSRHGGGPPPRAVAALRLQFTCPEGRTFADLRLDKLRLHLQGERDLMARLYETLFLDCLRVEYRLLEGETPIDSCWFEPSECLAQVGMDLHEGILPFPPQAFPGFRHLIELLSFPSKYSFVDLLGWQLLRETFAPQQGTGVEVILYFPHANENLERGLSESNFLLNCTPIVNLFSQSAEPVDFHHRQPFYWVVPSRAKPAGHEVYMIEDVHLLDQSQGRQGPLLPFYASRMRSDQPAGYWVATRRAAAWQDDTGKEIPGTEVDLHVVDSGLDLRQPTSAILDVKVLCTNRNVPSLSQQGGDSLVATGFPVQATVLQAPTKPLRPPLRHASFWRLLSQNALNHATLVKAPFGREALQELLRLCDFSGPDTSQLAAIIGQNIDGLTAVSSRPVRGQVSSGRNLGYGRGQEIELEFDERNYGGVGVLVFASVLERFLALYTGINSFVQVVVKTTQSKDILKKWPARTGERVLQ